jgi:hypothetical protein
MNQSYSKEDLLDKLKAMAYWDRVLMGGNKALQDAVDKHENGDDKPIPKK